MIAMQRCKNTQNKCSAFTNSNSAIMFLQVIFIKKESFVISHQDKLFELIS